MEMIFCILPKNYDVIIYSPINWRTSGFNYFLSEFKIVNPLPYYDIGNDLHTFFSGDVFNKDSWLFGFQTKEKLIEWFDLEFWNLLKKDYHLFLVTLKKEKIIYGTKQCVFFIKDVECRLRMNLDEFKRDDIVTSKGSG